jgi:peptidyl-prolyl cis-trans isomerase C
MKIFKFFKEPLFLIATAGILLFITYTALDNYLNKDENILFISMNDIAFLEQTWESRMNRPPTAEERKGLVDSYIQDQVMFKTALEMGLDKGDQVIKGRMVQKLRFLGNDLIRPPQPSEQDLITYYEKHKEEYIPEETITITHIYFDPDKRDDETISDANEVLEILTSMNELNRDVSLYGDPFMLQNYYPERTTLEIRKLFGRGFTESVFELEPGVWHGPVLSGYGTHLVYVHNHQKNELLSFEIVREQVKTEWMEEMQKKLNKKYVDGLMARYEIVFEEIE